MGLNVQQNLSAPLPQRLRYPQQMALGFGGAIAGMAYSLRGVSQEKLLDVGFGVLLAAIFLSIAFYLLLTTIRFLESDEKRYSLSPEEIE